MSTPTGTKKLSKLQMRIQAGLSNTSNKPTTSSTSSVTLNSTVGSQDQVMASPSLVPKQPTPILLVEPFSFPSTLTDLVLSPSSFSKALPPFPACSNAFVHPLQVTSLKFSQPALANAFIELSPDDRVMDSRKGTALGVAQ
ncbi:hypothetical protein CROQUDRAFT_75854 [Cronartium quercuum f. sp. fusiforme G11]|uniref:Uncharacterized protein n=1 Tax=Cronartium quercuum f. sp. fusiforme G11 TaxID=708437 RepID=A0A9P6NQ24_9BASI|nr:hypothetical protein CROQUDRAFT_75854 [Cronartium quercuum f. sp. fusiforme G11]